MFWLSLFLGARLFFLSVAMMSSVAAPPSVAMKPPPVYKTGVEFWCKVTNLEAGFPDGTDREVCVYGDGQR